jgi:hypothetical protein
LSRVPSPEDETARLFEALQRHAVATNDELQLVVSCKDGRWSIYDTYQNRLAHNCDSITEALRETCNEIRRRVTERINKDTRIIKSLDEPV